MSENNEERIPFVNVKSKGGIYDDVSYAAGYEMGILDVSLLVSKNPVIEIIIHTDNEMQADLIAMRHNWTCEVLEREEGYSYLRFLRNLEIIGERFLIEKEFMKDEEDDERA